MSIKCSSLTKYYNRKLALDNIDLEIADGKVTGLLGPNGAGKSTLIKLITGLLYPDKGCVTIDGFDVHGDHKNAMKHLGAIIEYPNFYADLSARRNLAILSGGHGREYEKKLAAVTGFLNIDSVLEKKVGTFSTGMKQRLGIALALLPDSRYIILDEPANGLDPTGIVEIRQLIKEYNRQFGITVLLSSHLLGEMEMICDNVVLLQEGALKAAGKLTELLARQHTLSVAAGNMAELEGFLQQSLAKKTPWIVSQPQMADHCWNFNIPDNADLQEISTALFSAGFAVTHFACKQQNLEDFFLRCTGKTQNGGTR